MDFGKYVLPAALCVAAVIMAALSSGLLLPLALPVFIYALKLLGVNVE